VEVGGSLISDSCGRPLGSGFGLGRTLGMNFGIVAARKEGRGRRSDREHKIIKNEWLRDN
jgi:hypothetical protein